MKKHLFLFTTLMFLVFAACSSGGGEDEPAPTPQPTPKPETPTITLDSSISSSGVSFSNGNGEQSISFTASTDWTLSIAEVRSGTSWCTPSATSGPKGDATVKFTVKENTEYDDRSVSVTIKAGTASKSFKITQKGVDALLVTSSTFEVDKAGGSIEVEVKSNINYQIEIAEAAKSWITETNSRALTTKKHKFAIAASEEYDKREGEIYIKSGDKKETVKVYQSGGAVLVLSNKEYTVSDAGETITVDIKSNFEYGVQMPNVDWISETSASRGMSSHTIKYTIAPNETYDIRSAEIVFYDKNSTLKDTVTIKQAQKNAIILSEKSVTVASTESTLEVKVNTNIDFTTKILDADWISEITSSRGLTEQVKRFKVSANSTQSSRTGQVAFVNASTGISDTLTITQSQDNALIVSQKSYDVSATGTTIDVKYQSNVDVEYEIPSEYSSWISAVPSSRGLTEYTQSFVISANGGYDSREGSIIFKDKNGTLKEVVTIKQAQKNAIILSEKSVTVASTESTLEVKVNTNIDFTTKILDADWISEITSSRGLTEQVKRFKVSANSTQSSRTGQVAFVNASTGISDTLTITQSQDNALIVSQKSYDVSATGTTIDVKYQSNVDVEYEIPSEYSSWISAVPSSRGLTEYTQSFVISANGGYDSREGSIIFKDKNGTLKEVVTIKQAQKNAIILSEKSVTVASTENTLEVKVNTNIDFTTKILDADWISEITSSRGLTEYTKRFKVTANTTQSSRTGQVAFVNATTGISDTLTITQSQDYALIVSQKSYDVSSSGATIDVKYQTNVDVIYEIPSEYSSWISAVPSSRGLTEYTQSFVISANGGYDSREGSIIFKDKNGTLKEVVTIKQAQKNAIILSKEEYEAEAKGGTIQVSFESNVEVTVTADCDWIKVNTTSSRSLVATTITLEISENTAANKRTGHVTISNGTLSETLSVTQKGKGATNGSIENFEEENQEW